MLVQTRLARKSFQCSWRRIDSSLSLSLSLLLESNTVLVCSHFSTSHFDLSFITEIPRFSHPQSLPFIPLLVPQLNLPSRLLLFCHRYLTVLHLVQVRYTRGKGTNVEYLTRY